MKVSLIFLFLFVGSLLAQEKKMPIDKLPPVTDWKRAYDHAKAGKTVQLVIRDAKLIKEPGDKIPRIRVYVVDGDNKYHVATVVPFPEDKVSSFLMDLSRVLERLPKAPSPDTKILITGGSYRAIEIHLRDAGKNIE
jgi:hypothetical protein